MRTSVVASAAELAELVDEWLLLWDRDPQATFYAHPDFVRPWWEAFQSRPGMELCVICVRDRGRLVALAPLAVHPERRRRVLRFTGRGDYLTCLVDGAAKADAVLKRVFSVIVDDLAWDTVSLSNIPHDSPVAGYLLRSKFNPHFEFWIENPYIDLREYENFASFRSQRAPSKAATYRNKIHREVGVEFSVVYGNPDGLFERIADLHRLEKDYLIQDKNREERHSLYDDPYRRRHIRSIFDATDRAVTFTYTDPEGDLLAYRTCFRNGRTLLSWNSAYHPRISRYRPGKALQYDIVEWLFRSDEVDVFDFGAGRYPWKFEWTGRFTVTYRLHLTEEDKAAVSGRPLAAASGNASPPEADAAALHEERAPGPLAASETPVNAAAPSTVARASASDWLRSHIPEPVKARLRPTLSVARSAATRRRLTRRRPTIWYIPHPDDETIFMGGSLRANLSQQNVLLLLTRGGASSARRRIDPKLDEPLSDEAFMNARESEFHDAASRLGIPNASIEVLDLPDGALKSADVRDVVRRMETRHPGWTHRTMSYLDPHRDHRAAGQAVRDAHKAGEISDCVFHLPYPLAGPDPGVFVAFSRQMTAAKRQALRAYCIWDPSRGRYAVGLNSVPELIGAQETSPQEAVHGWDVDMEPDHT